MCKCKCYSLRLPPGWRSVRNDLGTHVRKREEGRMRKGKRGETLNVFLGEGQEERTGEELECLEGAKAVTDCHSMYF